MKVSALLAAGALIATLASASAAEPATINLFAGYSELIKLHKRGTTLVVGDPTVADAVSAGNEVVLTGKAVGSTNFIVLDENDAEIYRALITVGRGVVVLRAHGASGYVCTPGGCRHGDGSKETLSSLPAGSTVSIPLSGGGTVTMPAGGGN
jgi:hypothetical protein